MTCTYARTTNFKTNCRVEKILRNSVQILSRTIIIASAATNQIGSDDLRVGEQKHGRTTTGSIYFRDVNPARVRIRIAVCNGGPNGGRGRGGEGLIARTENPECGGITARLTPGCVTSCSIGRLFSSRVRRGNGSRTGGSCASTRTINHCPLTRSSDSRRPRVNHRSPDRDERSVQASRHIHKFRLPWVIMIYDVTATGTINFN